MACAWDAPKMHATAMPRRRTRAPLLRMVRAAALDVDVVAMWAPLQN
ncbi:MAG: hypothetical protein QF733_02320 [Phycisphaerales bacterium]|nr:hypothetical protein [Phycisphaerales bacterium]